MVFATRMRQTMHLHPGACVFPDRISPLDAALSPVTAVLASSTRISHAVAWNTRWIVPTSRAIPALAPSAVQSGAWSARRGSPCRINAFKTSLRTRVVIPLSRSEWMSERTDSSASGLTPVNALNPGWSAHRSLPTEASAPSSPRQSHSPRVIAPSCSSAAPSASNAFDRIAPRLTRLTSRSAVDIEGLGTRLLCPNTQRTHGGSDGFNAPGSPKSFATRRTRSVKSSGRGHANSPSWSFSARSLAFASSDLSPPGVVTCIACSVSVSSPSASPSSSSSALSSFLFAAAPAVIAAP